MITIVAMVVVATHVTKHLECVLEVADHHIMDQCAISNVVKAAKMHRKESATLQAVNA